MSKASYKEQVLAIGNGTMLEPGYYDKNMKRIEYFNCRPLQDSKRSLVFHIICPNDLKFLKVQFFKNMENLQDIVLSDCMKDIMGDCFFGCSSLKQIQLPDGLIEIGPECFKYSGITSIEIPSSVRCIWMAAFSDCRDLVSFSMAETDQPHVFSDQTFYCCWSLKNVTLPKGLKWISDQMFYYCENLKKIILPESVGNIGSKAFQMCSSLEFIHIGTNMAEISDNAFGYPTFINDNAIVEYGETRVPIKAIRPMSLMKRIFFQADIERKLSERHVE